MLAGLQHEINSSKDPRAACLSILRRLNVEHSVYGDIINRLYAWTISQNILTSQHVQIHDRQLFDALERLKKRREEVAHTIKEDSVASVWGVEWYRTLGYKNVPGKDILGLCVTLSTPPLSLKMEDVLHRAAVIRAKDPPPVRGRSQKEVESRPTFKHLERIRDEAYLEASIPLKPTTSQPEALNRRSGIPKSSPAAGVTYPKDPIASEEALVGDLRGISNSTNSTTSPSMHDVIARRTTRQTTRQTARSTQSRVCPSDVDAFDIDEPDTDGLNTDDSDFEFDSDESEHVESTHVETTGGPTAAPSKSGRETVEPRREVRIASDGVTTTTVIHLPYTLAEIEQDANGFEDETTEQPDYSELEPIDGDVLFLTSDGKTLGDKRSAKVDTTKIASGFEDMRRVFANKRQRARVMTTALPVPEEHDYRHHALDEMRRLYLPSRCGVFHFCYRIPLGQKPETICLSSDMTSGCYKADAVWRFLEDCWGFQQQATDAIRSIDPELAQRSQRVIDKVRQWCKAFQIFGPTLFLGMAVLHNVRVQRHLDPGDDKLGLVAMTNWGNYDGGDLILHIMGRPYRLRYRAGDMITFRSAIVMHEIMPFQGERSAVVLFSKSNALAFVERTHERPVNPVIPLADTLDTDEEAERAELLAAEDRDARRRDGQEGRARKKRRGCGA
ncbi:hypothetical protein HD553DRAFT_342113 [Filobasidium floriforme]|uniref:uncharacterized protein n=1 Tax=Filobasidium floriforme TaxID=5210 RepID=UPI001E8E00C2|nr:uncharacterized protein HD553DRAFT_342113 [Filobasidium floriforme]KAH8084623.1 hypothetical protein HD553DRAFT_342113 [Filobasidium floriforme]